MDKYQIIESFIDLMKDAASVVKVDARKEIKELEKQSLDVLQSLNSKADTVLLMDYVGMSLSVMFVGALSQVGELKMRGEDTSKHEKLLDKIIRLINDVTLYRESLVNSR